MIRRAAILIALATLPAAAATKSAPYIPKEVDLTGLTAAEVKANRVWSLRAGLNVAALQCQYSPFLRTVPRYNGILKQHAKELESARVSLDSHFRRTGGVKDGPRAFDRYNTRLWSSYATVDAIPNFCATASEVGRTVSMQPIGKLGEIADAEVAKLRRSMTPVSDLNLGVQGFSFSDLGICADKKGRQIRC